MTSSLSSTKSKFELPETFDVVNIFDEHFQLTRDTSKELGFFDVNDLPVVRVQIAGGGEVSLNCSADVPMLYPSFGLEDEGDPTDVQEFMRLVDVAMKDESF